MTGGFGMSREYTQKLTAGSESPAGEQGFSLEKNIQVTSNMVEFLCSIRPGERDVQKRNLQNTYDIP